MAAFKILRTNHTSFTVSDIDRTIAFFRDALGCSVVSPKAPRDQETIQQITGISGADVMIAYLMAPGGHHIELIEYLAPKDRGSVRPRPCDTGSAHLAFDVDDIEAAIAAAKDHDVQPIGPIVTNNKGPNAGCKVVYLHDPDGITIEFLQLPHK